MITEPTPDAETYVTFFVGGHHFCISANEVEEVMLAPEITAVPLAPSHLAGLINLRGQIIPALCTAKLCAVDVPGGAKDPAATLILRIESGLVGLQVEGIGPVLQMTSARLEAVPANLEGQLKRALKGIHRSENGIVLVLNPHAFDPNAINSELVH